MRFLFYLLLAVTLFVVLERLVTSAARGELFKPGAFRSSFRQIGRDLWLGARLFVILWFVYLLVTWWVRHQG
jgi:ribose/xylose/arabinose/galactoside ABC-type transport system permease subunit